MSSSSNKQSSSTTLSSLIVPLIAMLVVQVGLYLTKQGGGKSRRENPVTSTTSSSSSSSKEVVFRRLTKEEAASRVDEALAEMNEGLNGTQIINNFIQNEATLRTLADPEFWSWCQGGGENNGGWITVDEEPKDLWQEIARKIWDSHPASRDAVGYEYWCNVLSKHDPLDWHFDKDEQTLVEKGELKTPTMGAVYYGFPHSFRGGYLEIFPADADTMEERLGELHLGVERIRAEYNRLVLLNVSQMHRVSPITDNGLRYALAVNVWHQKPAGF